MRHFFLLAALLAWLGGDLPAQNIQSYKSLDEITKAIVEPLDKTGIHSGILLQQAPMFVHPILFDGERLDSNNIMNASDFGKLFGQLRTSSVQKPVLPEPTIYLEDLKRLDIRKSDTIPLALMAMRYDYIRKDAFDLGLVKWSRPQKNCIDVSNRSMSPYLQDTLFVFSSMILQAQDNHIIFHLPSKMLFNNLGWKIDQVEIDFSDGMGWRIMKPDESIKVHYSSAGDKILQIRYYENNRYWLAHSTLKVPEVNLAERYSGMPDDEIELSGVKLNFFYNCKDHKLRKPLIIVEGFGGDRVDYRKMLALLDGQTTDIVTLNDFLDDEGYDLIWVDWVNSNASIQVNALALQEAIEFINSQKHADGSTEPNVMIGASMGGLVGKYCLLSMHNLQGKDSDVERFFTYDTPLKGANFPVGIQLMIRDLLSLSGSIASDPNIMLALNLLDGDAARQMLRYKSYISFEGLTLSTFDFDAFQAEMDALEDINPLTAITHYIQFSNGSGTNVSQESVTSAIAMELGLILDGVSTEPEPYWQYDILIQATAYTALPSTTLLYERTIEVVPIIGEDEILGYESYTHPTPVGLDAAPGGTANIGLPDLAVALTPALANVPDQIGYFLNIAIDHFCFVPTISSLGLPVSTDLNVNNPVSLSTASRAIVSTDNSVNSPYTNAPEYNQEHVSMNVHIADLLVEELHLQSTMDVIGSQLSNSQIYNFGRASVNGLFFYTPREIQEDLTIQSGGQLWINREGRIADISNLNNPQNLLEQKFDVSVPGSACDEIRESVITVEEGGQLLIGEYDGNVANSGALFFGTTSALIVNASQGVLIDDHSSMIFNNEATANINNGGEMILSDQSFVEVGKGSVFRIKTGGKFSAQSTAPTLIVREGGTLVIEEGATIELSDEHHEDGEASIKIEPGGTLRIEGKFNFIGNGYIWLQGKPTIPGSVDYEFPILDDMRSETTWEGEGKNVRRLFLDNFPLQNEGEPVFLKELQIDCYGIGGIVASNNDVRIINVRLEGAGFSSTGLGVTISEGNLALAQNTDFINLRRGLAVADMPTSSVASPLIENCHFEECTIGLLASNLRQLNIRFSEFNQCTGAAMTLFGISSIANVSNSNINGTGVGIEDINTNEELEGIRDEVGFIFIDPLQEATTFFNVQNFGVYAYDVTRFRMSEGTISNCYKGIFSPIQLKEGVPTASSSNFVFANQTTIEDNMIGIHVQEGFRYAANNSQQYFGMVMLDCAKLLDNRVGILGRNILLQLDAFSNSGTTNASYVRRNHFRRLGTGQFSRLFNVCYSGEYNPSEIFARGNYWENLVPNYTHSSWRLVKGGTCNGNAAASGTSINLNMNQSIAIAPTGCPNQIIVSTPGTPGPIPPGVEDPDGCLPPADEELAEKLGDQFYYAYKAFSDESATTGDFTGSDSLFQKVANMKEENVISLEEKCKKFVDASRAFVQFSPGEKPDKPEERNFNSNSNNIFVQPNPANEKIMIFSKIYDQSTLQVWNAQGCLIKDVVLNDGIAELDVISWPNGVYWVGSKDSIQQTLQKFIVQH